MPCLRLLSILQLLHPKRNVSYGIGSLWGLLRQWLIGERLYISRIVPLLTVNLLREAGQPAH